MSDQGIHHANPPTTAVHYQSHAAVLRRYKPGGRRRLDAIIVSTARSAGNVLPALRLGAALGVPVAAMCSRNARPDEVVAAARTVPGADVVVVDFADPDAIAFPRLCTTAASANEQVSSHGDLSIKRNTGLLLARSVDWRSVLFLDDDIDELDPAMVSRAAAGLDHHTAVGMPALTFPDNSAVCHAYRVGGGQQGVFVSGSALAIDIRAADSFFPTVYNEDWLFLAPHLDRRTVTSLGAVRQRGYAPFADPHRAEVQEFGDVLAEGLIGYLHTAPLKDGPPVGYWEAFLERRAELIANARQGCAAAEDHPDADAALVALDAAERARARISPIRLAEYVRAWTGDLAKWRRFLVQVPRLGDVRDAIMWLNVPAATVTAGKASPLSVPNARVGRHGSAPFQKLLAE